MRGAVIRWAIDTLGGGFGVRFSALPRIMLNKLLFVRSGGRFRHKGDAQLINIAVDPDYQGRGIANRLVREGLAFLASLGIEEVRLEVRPWNSGARAVYSATGWREIGRTRDLEGEWLVMVANPSASPM